ncbi:MAG: MBL fold metallo-hydrolase [Desulfurococcales archaeon]|nr:MBL fold metallo-hydrolase [Desulfurococcales archaeon]
MPAYLKISGSTYLVKGSPSSIVYVDDEAVYIVDPGHGGGKVKSLNKTIKDLRGDRRVIAVVTHYHSDHLEAIARKPALYDEVIASAQDASGVEDPTLRITATFGYPLPPDTPFLPFRAPPVRVSRVIRPGDSIGPLKTIHLPGHTPGQIGVLTPDGVLYAADAVFGSKVLERYQLPYHLNPCKALETLESLKEVEWEALVPGHGPIMKREEAITTIEANIQAIRRLLDSVVETLKTRGRLRAAEVTRLLVDPERAGGPGMYMLLEQTVRGVLACLTKDGRVRPSLDGEGLTWEAP